MRRRIILALAALCSTIALAATAQYSPDILGEDFEQQTITLQPDSRGEVKATLVRCTENSDSKSAILYVHGYNDYFFQREMAERFCDADFRFYALDLRRYGRSKNESERPFQVEQISDYYEEISAAVEIIRQEGANQIILAGHSTGGLITALYTHHHNANVDGLILNSPFFDMNMGWFGDNILVPSVSLFGAMFDDIAIPQGKEGEAGLYAMSLLKKYHGEWEFDTTLKYDTSLPITTGWIRAIHLAHKELQRGLEIDCPTLVLCSDHSTYESEWSDAVSRGDAVLDVEDITRYAQNIGDDVEIVQIKDALHDVVLSNKVARETAYDTIFDWIEVKKLNPNE